jgi:hypothetical protein
MKISYKKVITIIDLRDIIDKTIEDNYIILVETATS